MEKAMIDSIPDRYGGLACFSGTRVPVRNLFEHVEAGYTLDEFLASFPRVSAEQACFALREATKEMERAFGPKPRPSQAASGQLESIS